MRNLALLALSAVLAIVGYILLVDVRPAIQAWGRVPSQIDDLRAAVEHVPSGVVAQVLPVVDARAAAIQDAARAEIRHGVDRMDKRLGAALAAADARLASGISAADKRFGEVTATAAGIREDVRPVLAEAQETLAQTSGAVAVIRPQALGLIAAAKVTAGETAQTMRTVKQAAPEVAQSVVSVSRSADGIAADVKREVDEITRPKRWWQKLLGPFYTAGRVAAAFL